MLRLRCNWHPVVSSESLDDRVSLQPETADAAQQENQNTESLCMIADEQTGQCMITVMPKEEDQSLRISRIVIESSARIVEVYDDTDGYIGTYKGVQTSNSPFYIVNAKLEQVFKSVSLKMLSLQQKQKLEIMKINVFASVVSTPRSSNQPVQMPLNFQSSTVASMLPMLLSLAGTSLPTLSNSITHQTTAIPHNQSVVASASDTTDQLEQKTNDSHVPDANQKNSLQSGEDLIKDLEMRLHKLMSEQLKAFELRVEKRLSQIEERLDRLEALHTRPQTGEPS